MDKLVLKGILMMQTSISKLKLMQNQNSNTKIYKIDFKVFKISPSLESSQTGSNNPLQLFYIVILVDHHDAMT